MNCRESRDDDGLEFLSVLSHSRAKEGKNADAKHARWGRDAETGHGQRVKQRGSKQDMMNAMPMNVAKRNWSR